MRKLTLDQLLIDRKRGLRSARILTCDHAGHRPESKCPGAPLDRAIDAVAEAVARVQEIDDNDQ